MRFMTDWKVKQMGLTDIVKKELGRAKGFLFTPKKKEDMMAYLQKDLDDYLITFPENNREHIMGKLEKHLDTSLNKYGKHLGSWYQKAANVGGIAATIDNMYQHFVSDIPFEGISQYAPINSYFVLAKTIPEAVYMARYFKDSKDVIGIAKWLGMKAVELSIPVLGPLMGIGWTEKIVRQRILYETKKNFLKEIGLDKKKSMNKLDELAEKTTGYKIKPQPAYGMIPQYA